MAGLHCNPAITGRGRQWRYLFGLPRFGYTGNHFVHERLYLMISSIAGIGITALATNNRTCHFYAGDRLGLHFNGDIRERIAIFVAFAV